MIYFISIFTSILLIYIIILLYKNRILITTINKYEIIIDEQGKKNHEYNNQLMILKAYANNRKKINDYINLIIEDHKTGQNYEIRELNKLDDGIKNLLNYKMSKIMNNNIEFCPYIDLEAKSYFNKIEIKLYSDITKVIGVLIDNAIDEASLSKEKKLLFDIKKDDHFIIVNVRNSVSNKSKINKIGKRKYTTKGLGHGFGLMLVDNIIKNNKEIELVSDFKDNLFSQTMLIDIS